MVAKFLYHNKRELNDEGDGKQERKKVTGLYQQNNNSARDHVFSFCTFLAVVV